MELRLLSVSRQHLLRKSADGLTTVNESEPRKQSSMLFYTYLSYAPSLCCC